MTAEQRILTKVNGKDVYRWVKRRPRNEVLDCRVYAMHAAFGLGLHQFSAKRWTQLEAAVQPSADLLAREAPAKAPEPEQVIAPKKPAPQPVRRMARPATPRIW